MAKAKTRAQQIAEQLEASRPKDFDPEEDNFEAESDQEDESEASDNEIAATEHYVAVGKSKLRKQEEVTLGPQYAGSRISRKELFNGNRKAFEQEDESLDDEESGEEEYADPDTIDLEADNEDGDIDSDDALGESDIERFKNFSFRGSSKPSLRLRKAAQKKAVISNDESRDESDKDSEASDSDEDMLNLDAQHPQVEYDSDDTSVEHNNYDSSGEDDDSDDATDESNDENRKANRDELRKMMAEEQKLVVATISKAAKADADKGNAVKQQRKAFDSLLNVRIRLQKALVAANSMAASEETITNDASVEPYEAAEEAAIKLWNTLDVIRHQLIQTGSTNIAGKKRKRDAIEISTPSSTIWEKMRESEAASIDQRHTTLEKWSARVKGATSVQISRKLNTSAQDQTITSVLQEQLVASEHLIKRTKMPRSCAPVQAKLKVTQDANIFDDADFYQLLLKELVDQRMMDSSRGGPGDGAGGVTQWSAIKDAKTRKSVDTKASKGRKMRYTVHEKLQNFMAPEDRGSWEQDAIDRFFGTLLGQKLVLGEEDAGPSDDEDVIDPEEAGLMLFRSQV